MADVELRCHGCLQPVDEALVWWFQPFTAATATNDGNTIETYSSVTNHQTPGSVPYCPECLKRKVTPVK